MSERPQIPFGYKQVDPYAPTQKGDGKWDGGRFRRVKKEYPRVGEGEVVIRKCEVVQAVIPATVPDEELEWVETP
jgi:hypothetical protein